MSADAVQRWRLDISYDGSGFSGWATQPGCRTIQGELETWLPRVLRLAEPVSLVCAGRTDAGVHARGQVAHVDLPAHLTQVEALPVRLARVLPGDLLVHQVHAVPAAFDARFSAIWRRYVYRLWDSPLPPEPLSRTYVAWVREQLDLERLNRAAVGLLGLRDFAAFCRSKAGGSTIRTLLELHGSRVSVGPLAGTVELTARADAFCHSMVRSLVGALVAVASGRKPPNWLPQVAAGPERNSSIFVMPAHGLTLEEVAYPPDDQLAARAQQARSLREAPGV